MRLQTPRGTGRSRPDAETWPRGRQAWEGGSRALRAGRRDGAAAPAKAGGSVEGPGGAGGRGAGHTPTAPAAFPLGARAQPPTRTAAWRVRGSLGPPFSGGRPTGLRLTERTSEPTPDAVGGGRQRPRPASHGAGAAGLRSPRRGARAGRRHPLRQQEETCRPGGPARGPQAIPAGVTQGSSSQNAIPWQRGCSFGQIHTLQTESFNNEQRKIPILK